MLLHILKKDLKRKKAMNAIVLVFIMLAATFMASSVGNVLTVLGAIDYFNEISNVPDFVAIVAEDADESGIERFVRESAYTDQYEMIDMYVVTDERIKITECAKDPDNQVFKKQNTMAIGAASKDFLRLFDENDNPIQLENGEMAVPALLVENNNLSLGDKIEIRCEDNKMEFTVTAIVKDAVFGAEMVGFKRLTITEEDYAKLTDVPERSHTSLISVNCTDTQKFQDEFKNNDFQIIISAERSTLEVLHVFDMVIAGILLIISVCLIIVSLLILRFTIVFTLQEDYKEIGIMKAIGVKDRTVRAIYLVKYLAISVFGSFVGLLISFPFGQFMTELTMKNMVTRDSKSGIVINVGSSILIVLIVLAFCYLSTGKLNHFSAIEAIRNGNKGERYTTKSLLKLNKRKWMIPSLYMAFNDVTGNVKRFVVLAITFFIGTLMILLPMTVIHTLNDNDIITVMGMQKSDLFIDSIGQEKYVTEGKQALLDDMSELETNLRKDGMDVNIWAETWYMIPCYSNDEMKPYRFYIQQLAGNKEDDYKMLRGEMPIYENEAMITEITAKEMNVDIGDSIYLKYPDHTQELVITGTYQSLINLGKGYRVSHDTKLDDIYLCSVTAFQLDENGEPVENPSDFITKYYPKAKLYSCQEYVKVFLAWMLDQLDFMKVMIVGVVLIINVLITMLIMKMFLTKDRGEIAMLKSIGFGNRTIKAWQSFRILVVLGISIILGVIFVKLFAPFIMNPIFGLMGGTNIELKINALEAYVIIPILMFVATGMAAQVCARDVSKVDLREINNLE